jgi:hypothetical protein
MEQFIIIILGIAVALSFVLSIVLEHEVWRGFFVMLLLVTFTIFSLILDKDGYKDGQIDALKGKYKYEMKISYEKELDFYVLDSIVVDSSGSRLGIDENGNLKIYYYQSYYPDTIWETVFVPVDTQFVKK